MRCFERTGIVIFSLDTAPAFTEEPRDQTAVEGYNLTLEWRYNFGVESFRQLIFGNSDIPLIVEKFSSDKVPYVALAFSGRLLASVTDTYASITFLPVNRADTTTYQVTLVSSSRETIYSKVEILVQCKCKRRNKTIYTLRTYILLCFIVLFREFWFYARVRGSQTGPIYTLHE